MEKQNRPDWWVVYLIGAGMLFLMFLEIRQGLTETGLQIAESLTLCTGYGLISHWLSANTGKIARDDLNRARQALRLDGQGDTQDGPSHMALTGYLITGRQRITLYGHNPVESVDCAPGGSPRDALSGDGGSPEDPRSQITHGDRDNSREFHPYIGLN